MSLPTGKDVQAVDPILTNMLLAYYQSENRFVADRVFPGVSVPYDSGTYYYFPKGYWFGDNAQPRAYGANYARGDFGVSTDTFTTIQYALMKTIADEERANSQLPMDLETAAIRWLGMQQLIRRERAWASDFMKTGVWSDGTITNKWSDYEASDPIADIRTGKRYISQRTGFAPNKLVIGEIVEDRLINHPDLIDRIKFTQMAGVGNVRSALASLFGVDEILVAAAIYNTVNETQTASMSPIVDDDALLIYATPTPGIFEASAGYTFYWAPGGGLGGIQPIVRDVKSDADLIKTKQQFDQKATATDLGYFMADCVD